MHQRVVDQAAMHRLFHALYCSSLNPAGTATSILKLSSRAGLFTFSAVTRTFVPSSTISAASGSPRRNIPRTNPAKPASTPAASSPRRSRHFLRLVAHNECPRALISNCTAPRCTTETSSMFFLLRIFAAPLSDLAALRMACVCRQHPVQPFSHRLPAPDATCSSSPAR